MPSDDYGTQNVIKVDDNSRSNKKIILNDHNALCQRREKMSC